MCWFANAGVRALTSGSTTPDALATFVARGVSMRSHPGLLAEAYVGGRRRIRRLGERNRDGGTAGVGQLRRDRRRSGRRTAVFRSGAGVERWQHRRGPEVRAVGENEVPTA